MVKYSKYSHQLWQQIRCMFWLINDIQILVRPSVENNIKTQIDKYNLKTAEKWHHYGVSEIS